MQEKYLDQGFRAKSLLKSSRLRHDHAHACCQARQHCDLALIVRPLPRHLLRVHPCPHTSLDVTWSPEFQERWI